MGQELLEVGINNNYYYKRTPRKFFLATSSTGLRAIRGSASKVYSHACIATSRSEWGWVTNTWSSRLDLAKRSASGYNKWGKGVITFEVVEAVEITAKEARQINKELKLEIQNYKENRGAKI
jgi:hypothetical protein